MVSKSLLQPNVMALTAEIAVAQARKLTTREIISVYSILWQWLHMFMCGAVHVANIIKFDRTSHEHSNVS